MLWHCRFFLTHTACIIIGFNENNGLNRERKRKRNKEKKEREKKRGEVQRLQAFTSL